MDESEIDHVQHDGDGITYRRYQVGSSVTTTVSGSHEALRALQPVDYQAVEQRLQALENKFDLLLIQLSKAAERD